MNSQEILDTLLSKGWLADEDQMAMPDRFVVTMVIVPKTPNDDLILGTDLFFSLYYNCDNPETGSDGMMLTYFGVLPDGTRRRVIYFVALDELDTLMPKILRVWEFECMIHPEPPQKPITMIYQAESTQKNPQ